MHIWQLTKKKNQQNKNKNNSNATKFVRLLHIGCQVY